MPADDKVDVSQQRKEFIKREIGEWNSFIADASVRNDKYAQMKADAFSFFRGTAHLFYKDLDNGTIAVPSVWYDASNIRTWISGDLHPQNFGFFDDKNRDVVFDVNDFDECFVAPFFWDLIRFSSGVCLLEDLVDFKLSEDETGDIVMAFLTSYQNALFSDPDENLTTAGTSGFIKKQIENLTHERSNASLLSRWTTMSSGLRAFDFGNGKIAVPTSSQTNEITSGWEGYCRSLGPVHTRCEVKGIAVRIKSGLGSLGVSKFYVLIEGADSSRDGNVILEVKEQRVPGVFKSAQVSISQCDSWFPSHGHRVLTAYRAMLKDAEESAGVLVARKSYSVKKLSPWKDAIEPLQFVSKNDLLDFSASAGAAIARCHSRSDNRFDSRYVPYSAKEGIVNAIRVWPETKKTIRRIARAYAKQVLADWEFFTSAF